MVLRVPLRRRLQGVDAGDFDVGLPHAGDGRFELRSVASLATAAR